MTAEQITERLHILADSLFDDGETEERALVARATGQFVVESTIRPEGEPDAELGVDPIAMGYGVMLGYMLREEGAVL